MCGLKHLINSRGYESPTAFVMLASPATVLAFRGLSRVSHMAVDGNHDTSGTYAQASTQATFM